MYNNMMWQQNQYQPQMQQIQPYNTMQPYFDRLQNLQQKQQSQFPQSNVNWIQVNGIDGAKSQIVQQGQTLWMMDNNDKIFYIKSVDNVGSANLKMFRFEEIDGNAIQQNSSTIIAKDEYESLKNEINDLRKEIEELKDNKQKQQNRPVANQQNVRSVNSNV